jgi:hypothetical protein
MHRYQTRPLCSQPPHACPLGPQMGLCQFECRLTAVIHGDAPGRGRDHDRRRVGHGGDGQRRGMPGANPGRSRPRPTGASRYVPAESTTPRRLTTNAPSIAANSRIVSRNSGIVSAEA